MDDADDNDPQRRTSSMDATYLQPNNPTSDPIVITELADSDILLGRGALAISHRGNIRFREIVSLRKHEYTSTNQRRTKDTIAQQVLYAVGAGRFVRKLETPEELLGVGLAVTRDAWVVVSEKKLIFQKIKQALRDKEPEPRQLKEEPPDFSALAPPQPTNQSPHQQQLSQHAQFANPAAIRQRSEDPESLQNFSNNGALETALMQALGASSSNSQMTSHFDNAIATGSNLPSQMQPPQQQQRTDQFTAQSILPSRLPWNIQSNQAPGSTSLSTTQNQQQLQPQDSRQPQSQEQAELLQRLLGAFQSQEQQLQQSIQPTQVSHSPSLISNQPSSSNALLASLFRGDQPSATADSAASQQFQQQQHQPPLQDNNSLFFNLLQQMHSQQHQIPSQQTHLPSLLLQQQHPQYSQQLPSDQQQNNIQGTQYHQVQHGPHSLNVVSSIPGIRRLQDQQKQRRHVLPPELSNLANELLLEVQAQCADQHQQQPVQSQRQEQQQVSVGPSAQRPDGSGTTGAAGAVVDDANLSVTSVPQPSVEGGNTDPAAMKLMYDLLVSSKRPEKDPTNDGDSNSDDRKPVGR